MTFIATEEINCPHSLCLCPGEEIILDDVAVLVPVLKEMKDLTELRLGLKQKIHARKKKMRQILCSSCSYVLG